MKYLAYYFLLIFSVFPVDKTAAYRYNAGVKAKPRLVRVLSQLSAAVAGSVD